MNNEEQMLRQYIRQAIRINQNRKLNEERRRIHEENKLRHIIRKLLTEAGEDQPKHASTGINVLEDLLKKIVPVLQADFKILTTSENQRKSFRSHILNAVQNSLSTEYMYVASKIEEAVTIGAGEDGKIGITDQEKFIDVLGSDETPEEEQVSPEDQFSKGLEGQNLDTTGRNMAMQTYKKIEKSIADAYSLLDDNKDRELFYDYLITNLKLYFDKFEEEMDAVPEAEPTTPEYEQEKKRKAEEDQGTAEPLAGTGPAEEAPAPPPPA
jgi:hypothetical protein